MCALFAQPRSLLTISDLGTLCPESSLCVCATPVASTHIIHIDLSHCWMSELITHGLQIEIDAVTL